MREYPVPKFFSNGKFWIEDQFIKSRFGYKNLVSDLTSRNARVGFLLFFWYMFYNGIICIAVTKGLSNIFSHKPNISLIINIWCQIYIQVCIVEQFLQHIHHDERYASRVKEAIHIRLHPNNINRYSGSENPQAGCLRWDNRTAGQYPSWSLREQLLPLIMPTMLRIKTHKQWVSSWYTNNVPTEMKVVQGNAVLPDVWSVSKAKSPSKATRSASSVVWAKIYTIPNAQETKIWNSLEQISLMSGPAYGVFILSFLFKS